MTSNAPKTIFLKDYQAPDFSIASVHLSFDIKEGETLVHSILKIKREGQHSRPLILHGQELELLSVSLDGETLSDQAYELDTKSLSVATNKDTFELRCSTRIYPEKNTSLEGLYKSRLMFCTQCEAEGFRKITYYLDRPDVLSVFTTKITADKDACPVLLSNGNLVGEGELADGRHWAEWHDPHAKPCYLFALVAGKLSSIESHFVTQSQRNVTIKIYAEEKDLKRCDYAMDALKRSMRWDEEVYGREYDLDIFMIVAVDDFNMGAMENKGLNIFNTSCVLAHPESTTDAGFQRVEAVVAHEYFHNWSGNRVTCRDWFQLSLKEGFTVFRDAEFSADMGSRTVKRVEDVQMLRTHQFAEDAGPMAHPVRPASFIEISNFYTLTVYEKGAEVVRMIRTLIGADAFRKGSDLYFDRHDGQAATIEDFIDAMHTASGYDFTQFMNWYHQAGTPECHVQSSYDASKKQYTLTLKQRCPTTPEAEEEQKQPFVIPLNISLLTEDGAVALGQQGIQVLDKPQQSFTFDNIPSEPVPVLLRGFSAPVKLYYDYSDADLLRILALETDGFSRWDAAQTLMQNWILRMVEDDQLQLSEDVTRIFEKLLLDTQLDPAMVALTLDLPSEAYLGQQQKVIDVDGIHRARSSVRKQLSLQLQATFKTVYERCEAALAGPYEPSAQAIALRSLKNTALRYLMASEQTDSVALAEQQYRTATNMSDQLSAMTVLVHAERDTARAAADRCLAAFLDRWRDDALVMNSWFSVQASSSRSDALETVKQLMQHPQFDGRNPNKIRSLIGVFAGQNAVRFHDESGEGYAFLADQIIRMNEQNPQIASRLLTPLTKWRQHNSLRQTLMKGQLERIAAQPVLSPDVFEVVQKSLT